ncbi:ABC transporter substrate-binding protein [Streptomyces zingiberis]|uniref:ABC transporter substrate-binding protein n=1 Tax=Streptomyces zingiberis TaxID=2053010 RepID=A0ABX1BX53_9ACTN|nr:ABC transporter substrate-binding protein [Streptomyces zingiberis]NJQ01003.1 ABC transporter substrate-binding protein [Streptomyces zingiberis]
MRKSLGGGRSAVVALVAGALLLTGCSEGGGGGGEQEGGGGATAQEPVPFAGAKASTGPAEPIPGAEAGGTIRVLQRDSYAHLDPAQIYVADEGKLAALIHRRLTTVKMDNDGDYSVVGDLATDSGTRSDDGRTWTYTLKDGIRFEDGSPITSADIRHTFERLFADFVTEGPAFVQSWMADDPDYRDLLPGGPYDGDHLPDSVLETPDDKTVVFHFEKPQNDLPYALGMPGYGVVSRSKDTREKYDRDPLASGPYRVQSFKPGKSMSLVRNPEWDARTDPARHQYPEKFEITFNHQYEDSSKRLLSDTGENQRATSFNNSVDASTVPQVTRDEAAKARTVSGYQTYVAMYAINMDRIKDHKVRQAIAHALPIKSVLAPYGGSAGGELAGGVISPLLPGHEKGYDPFGKLKKPGGDPAKARELLKEAGQEDRKLVFAFRNDDESQQEAVAVTDALREAGFDVQRKELPTDTFYDRIGKVDNGYDLYRSNWGHDWVSASTVIPPLFDGRKIADGASNYPHVDDEKINSEIDRISGIADPEKAATEWFELSKYIIEDVTPVVPVYFYKQMQISGSKIGGAVYNNDLSGIDPNKLYVKK